MPNDDSEVREVDFAEGGRRRPKSGPRIIKKAQSSSYMKRAVGCKVREELRNAFRWVEIERQYDKHAQT